MRVRTVDSTDHEWKGFLHGTDYDIFHTPEFLRVEDEFRGTTTRLIVIEEGGVVLLMPLVFSPLPGGLKDASSPTHFAGPVFSRGAGPEWRQRAVAAALDYLREDGVVSLFLHVPPLAGLEDFATVGEVMEHGPTFAIPLDRTLEEIMTRMRQGHRRNMRKAARDGLVAEQDVDWTHLDDFHGIYSHTMDRVGASPSYRFDHEYFEGLRDDVREHSSLWVLKMDGVVAGAHVVTECNGTVQYLLGATHPEFHRRVPQVAIFDAVLRWAHERRNTSYFLGGGAQESLRHFKAGFTQEQRPASTARVVVDPSEYRRLSRRWETMHGSPEGRGETFFPVYRAPTAAAV